VTPDELSRQLSSRIGPVLANDLVTSFVELRKDCRTCTLGRSSAGKFIETVVQVLQYLETNRYDATPQVDSYLKTLESRASILPEDLRICCSRIARAAYTVRNKRNIAHKGTVAPNIYDLNYTYAAAQWILSEIVRQTVEADMTAAGAMIEFIQVPVSSVVERVGERRIVHGKLTIEKELLLLLHSYYPEYVPLKQIQQSMERRSKPGISNGLKNLWSAKLLHREPSGYVLTQEGFKEAVAVLSTLQVG